MFVGVSCAISHAVFNNSEASLSKAPHYYGSMEPQEVLIVRTSLPHTFVKSQIATLFKSVGIGFGCSNGADPTQSKDTRFVGCEMMSSHQRTCKM